MVSIESVVRPASLVGAGRSFYRSVRTTVEWSGAIAILLQSLILAAAFGSGAALLLLVVAALVTAAQLLENSRRDLVAEISEPRNWRNALANAGVATAFALLSLLSSSTQLRSAFVIGAVATLAASLSDSLSHEIGVVFGGTPRLITTWQLVEPGENGGVSLIGSVVGIVSAFGLAGLAIFAGLIELYGALLAGTAACAGNLLDSLLGATVERRGLLANDAVNFSAVCFAGAIVLLTFFALSFS